MAQPTKTITSREGVKYCYPIFLPPLSWSKRSSEPLSRPPCVTSPPLLPSHGTSRGPRPCSATQAKERMRLDCRSKWVQCTWVQLSVLTVYVILLLWFNCSISYTNFCPLYEIVGCPHFMQGLKCKAYNGNAICTWAKRLLKQGVRISEVQNGGVPLYITL